MMGLYEGTTIMKIAVECQKEFQQKYYVGSWWLDEKEQIRKVDDRSVRSVVPQNEYVIQNLKMNDRKGELEI